MGRPAVKPDTQTAVSLPLLHTGASREEFLAYFDNSWQLTELIFSALTSDDAYVTRPYHKLRHPKIFYYGHPVALYVNKLRLAGLLDGPINAEYERMFETGVDEMRWDELHEEDYIWPTVDEVRSYRQQAYGIIRAIIENHPGLAEDHAPILPDSPLWALVMGFEHERIHLETSTVLMRELPLQHVQKPAEWPASIGLKPEKKTPQAGVDYPANPMIQVGAQSVSLGKPADMPSFGWDNEYGAQTRRVAGFAASKQLISNGEFYAFVTGGGYQEKRFWSEEGWQWRGFRNSKWPCFWVPDGPSGLHHYKLRLCFEVVPMQWDWPACVNYHEAKAFAAWKSEQDGVSVPYRLLTEGEHMALRDEVEGDPVMDKAAGDLPYNLNLASGSECPVTAFPANSKGFHDAMGNVWQWLEDHFHPLPGSAVHPLYVDFSEPCYDGEHQMILGGSFISTGDEASKYARFHFRPHFFQHAGFRLSQSVDGPASGTPVYLKRDNASYDGEAMLNTYMLMHWGSEADIYDRSIFDTVERPNVVELPLACAQLLRKHSRQFGRALDLGCAVGRASFEMARDFQTVIGIDYSQNFVAAAQKLQEQGQLTYWRRDHGDSGAQITAQVDAAIDRSRLSFEQGDANALRSDIGTFDAVLMANLLCRLSNPQACLAQLQGANAIVNKGGIVVMTTPFSWFEHFTPRDRWLADVPAIAAILTEYELVEEQPLPFMIREHRRKFEYIITHASVWRRIP